ncbi:MAG: hypothetical protein ACPGUD_03230 [Parashewanella sp.]
MQEKDKYGNWTDLISMQTEVALLSSMTRSKTLTAMVLVGLALFGSFVLFLMHMAGKM